jgi:tRNA threonylcarbamoyladenosine biosynthesis protein TsaB
MILGAGDGPVLALDASTYRGSVAVIRGMRVLAEAATAMRGTAEQGERLMPAVADVLGRARVRVGDLGAIVCGAGPGSFTSLRIAAAIAKGIAQGADIPMGAVPSLLLIVAGCESLADGRYLASLDALRGERFAAVIEVARRAGQVPELIAGDGAAPALVPVADLAIRAAALGATAIGPGCAIEAWPEARAVTRVAEAVHRVDPATWEPDYGRRAEAEVRRSAAARR